jgi:hypothetical protein
MSGYRIHTHTAAEAGLLVNSYLVEAADGVGAAESHADSYVTLDDRAFIGDLAFNGTHPYTADGHTGELAGDLSGAAEAVAV